MRTFLCILGAAMLLAACGGSDDRRDDPAALLFDDLAAAQHGGWRSVGLDLVQSEPGAGTLCGYNVVPTLREIENDLREVGGEVTESTADKWCGETSSQTYCVLRAGGSLVTDAFYPGTPAEREIELVIPGLRDDARAYFYYRSDSQALASADIETPDFSISSDNCTPRTVTQSRSTIDGDWEGYELSYAPSVRAGSERAALMNCEDHDCLIEGESSFFVLLTDFDATGAWHGEESGRVVGAAISEDGESLALYACTTPLVVRETLSQCKFYGFSRS